MPVTPKIVALLIGLIQLTTPLTTHAQTAYKQGDVVPDMVFTTMLNSSYSNATLNKLKTKLTVLDFFGTWCVPCRKALPVLTQLQQQYKGVLSVVLISVEEKAKLQAFLQKQGTLAFPIVVDEKEAITARFQPPSLPYTVVLNEANKIVAITEAGDITSRLIDEWLAGKTTADPELPIGKRPPPQPTNNNYMPSANSTVRLSQDFIYAAKTGDSTALYTDKLKTLDYSLLVGALKTDNEKLAFWVNLYNGYTQLLLKADPDKYKDRNAFFTTRQITVAGKNFSLDDIEHGILRHSKIKWSLGHVNKLFPGKMEKALRVRKLDYRLHFALNCGAKSCPPIAFYAPEKLEQQLALATANYLKSEAEYKSGEATLYLPALMGWFRGDFGGKKGMRKLAVKQGLIADGSKAKIKFKKYDWDLYLANYQPEPATK